MCFKTTNVTTTSRQNWEGDEIEHRPIIEAARVVPGTRKRYSIDVREFLSIASNALIFERCSDALEALPMKHQALARSHKPGSFDLRVRTACDYLAKTLTYKRKQSKDRKPETWFFPDETLENGGGDCEDHAFLLAAMILALGVSGYVVRVALGKFVNLRTHKAMDHAWVVYKTESGQWIVLDPLVYTKEGQASSKPASKNNARKSTAPDAQDSYEYRPRFVFNDAHLWSISGHKDEHDDLESYASRRKFWHTFDPSFAASVHASLFDETLGSMSWVNRQYVKAVSLAVDANIATYDPRDHFDNAYIDDGWALVKSRLKGRDLNDFALACHAIGDFYAHSSWGVFGERVQKQLQPLLNPKAPKFSSAPDYSATGPFPFTDPKFSINEARWHGPRSQVAQIWKGKLISGRYAQDADKHQTFFERLTYIPDALKNRGDYTDRTGLPHHNEIAVDDATRNPLHRLYDDKPAPGKLSYAEAFAERRATAKAHIAAVYASWPGRKSHE